VPKLIANLLARLPLQFRVLYQQFLLRVVDLESLSIEADVPRFLGQFAGVLIMFSLIQALAAFMSTWAPPATPEAFQMLAWPAEQRLISTMLLVAGIIAVVGWESTFPDRRDAMVLAPLPVRSRTILLAKVAAWGTILAIAVLCLNVTSGLAWPLVLGGVAGFPRFLLAYWFTMFAGSAFLLSSVLLVQGMMSLLLPRRIFLRLSTLLQILAFGVFLAAYFFEPYLIVPAQMAAPENQWILASSPTFWFFALLNQLNGSMPTELAWLARRAWLGLAVGAAGALSALLLSYLRTMRKTIEEPDLVSSSRWLHWPRAFGGGLRTAIVLFSFRSLVRSRQHRLAFVFYLALALAALPLFLNQPPLPGTEKMIPLEFIAIPYLFMTLTIVGLRRVFALPVSLRANWVLQTTQRFPMRRYVGAARLALLLIAALPLWLISALFAFLYRPAGEAATHATILALVAFVLVDASLIGFNRVPFACSYLPGKANFQLVFWVAFLMLLPTVVGAAVVEQRALASPAKSSLLIAGLLLLAIGLWALNRHRAGMASLSFEDEPPEVITTLHLRFTPPVAATSNR